MALDNEGKPDFSTFEIGYVGDPKAPTALVVKIPIAEYGDIGADGLDWFYGRMKRVEATGANLIREAFMRKQKNGIIAPAAPVGPLKVH